MSQTVRGVISRAKKQPIELVDIVIPDPGPGEVVVDIIACGVCHTDLTYREGGINDEYPFLLGHEAAGTVESVGEGVTHVAPGDFVILNWRAVCGECRACKRGRPHLCFDTFNATQKMTLTDGTELTPALGIGAFADKTLVHERQCTKVDSEADPAVAGLLGCGVMAGIGAAINTGAVGRDDTVAVIGCGGVGMAAMLTALAHDDVRVVAVDRLPDKLEQARALGAHDAVTDPGDLKADVVIEAAGHPAALETAIGVTAPGGKTITVGLPHPDARISVSPLALVADGRSLIGSYLGSAVPARDIPRFVELWRSGRLPVEKLVSDTISLDDINTGMDALADGRAVRQIVQF